MNTQMECNDVNSNSFINKITHLLVNYIMFVPRAAKCNVTLTQTHLRHAKSTRLTTVGQQTHNLNAYTQTNKQTKATLKSTFRFEFSLNSQGSRLNNVSDWRLKVQ